MYCSCSSHRKRGMLIMWLDFLWAFIVGGAICVVGQIMFDVFKLTPAHTMTTLVVIGAIIDGLGWYDPFIEFAGAGATVPITSFGNALVHGALAELKSQGWIGLITGIFEVTSAGVSAAIIFSFFAALLFKPKG
jgi:stage V sporulation protein AE